MIIVIAGKQECWPKRKTEELPACVQFSLTAHAGTFIRPRNRAGNSWSRIWERRELDDRTTGLDARLGTFRSHLHLGFTHMFCFGSAIVACCGMGFTHTKVNQKPFAFKNIQSEMSSGFPSIHSPLRAFFLTFEQKGSG